MLQAIVHAADIQDRDGGAMLLAAWFGMFPFLLKLYADGGYQGPEFQCALRRVLSQAKLQIVSKRSADPTLSRIAPLMPYARHERVGCPDRIAS